MNTPMGLEQGFTLVRRPVSKAAGDWVTLALARLPARVVARVYDGGRGLELLRGGRVLVRYAGLFASDAGGRGLSARVGLVGRRLLLRVDDRGARYPLRIDPFVQAAKLTASDGAANDLWGYSVAISGDGSTVVAARRQLRSGGGVRVCQAHIRLGDRDPVSQADRLRRRCRRRSWPVGGGLGDGSTVIAGAPGAQIGASAGQGAAYVFVRPNAGWANATESAKLTASDGADRTCSATRWRFSGGTVVAGAGAHSYGSTPQGAAYVFVKPHSAAGRTRPSRPS